MKNWIIYTTSIFICLNIFSQKHIKTFDDAIKEFNSGNYELSIPYFKRMAFFESNNILNLKYLADGYQKTKSYDNAIAHYSLIFNVSKDDSIKNEVIIEIAKCYISQEKFDYAEIEIFNLKESDSYFISKKNYYLFLIYLLKGEYDKSKNHILKTSNLSSYKISEIDIIFSDFESFIKRKNPKLSSNLSMILPGSGQIYLGDYNSGINSFLLTSTALTIFTIIRVRYSLFDAFFSIFPYYQRYYIGGILNAKNISKYQIDTEKSKVIKRLNKIIIS